MYLPESLPELVGYSRQTSPWYLYLWLASHCFQAICILLWPGDCTCCW